MKKIITITAAMLIWTSTFAQIVFQKTFGGPNDDEGASVQQTIDGGYIVSGTTQSFGTVNDHVYLLKINSHGDTLWTKTNGGALGNAYDASSIQQTTDGGYIIGGFAGSGNADFYLLKTDATGNTLWAKNYGGTDNDFGGTVHQTTDGGYIICGTTLSFGAGWYDFYVIKTAANGDTLWTKTYGGTHTDGGGSIQQTTDGGYIILGNTFNSFGSGSIDAYLIKTNASGDTLWTKTYGGTYDGNCVQQTTDGGYIIMGTTSSFGAGASDVYLLKANAVGEILWTKTYGGTGYDYGVSVQQTADGGYIIGGSTESFGAGAGYADVYLIRTNATGDTLWTKTYGGTGTEYGVSVRQATDGGYIITGNTTSFGAGNRDVYLIKTDANGNSGCHEGNIATIVNSISPITFGTTTQYNSTATIVGSPATVTGSGGTVTGLCYYNCFPSLFSQSPNICSGQNITVGSNIYSVSGTYYDTLTSVTSCDSIVTTHLTVHPLPTVTATSQTICSGQSATITGSGAATYLWNTGQTSASITVSPTTTTSYTVTGTSSGCSKTATSTVTVHPLPTVTYSQSPSLVCVNNTSVPLSGAYPAGGTFTGTAVTGTHFNAITSGVGTFTITYSYTDANSCTNTATSSITVSACTGIAQNTIDSEIEIYPNPSSGIFTVKLNKKTESEVCIYDALGNCVLNKLSKNETSLNFDLCNQPQGIYFVEIISDGERNIKKIVLE